MAKYRTLEQRNIVVCIVRALMQISEDLNKTLSKETMKLACDEYASLYTSTETPNEWFDFIEEKEKT